MPFIDLYSNEFRQRNRGHFASIVCVALEDNKITDCEKKFLDRLAVHLEISDEMYKQILENPSKYPTNPPVRMDLRIERLYDLIRIVHVDDELDKEVEAAIIKKFVVGLGFKTEHIDKIISKSLDMVSQKVDQDQFEDEIYKITKK